MSTNPTPQETMKNIARMKMKINQGKNPCSTTSAGQFIRMCELAEQMYKDCCKYSEFVDRIANAEPIELADDLASYAIELKSEVSDYPKPENATT